MENFIDIARGLKEADLVLKNLNIVNVYSGEIEVGDIAIHQGKIVGVGTYKGVKEIDCFGKFAMPGLIDSHIHIESSMLNPFNFSKEILKNGVTSIIADPHEIANVCGEEGINYMIDMADKTKLNAKFVLPSCVPATSFETAGAVIDSKMTYKLLQREDIIGLGEFMNYPGILFKDAEVLAKIKSAIKANKIIDGHAPCLSSNDLNAYKFCSISTEHEATSEAEALEKIRKGFYIIVREGTGAKNLKDLINLAKTDAYRRMLFCMDDCHPYELLHRGTINYCIKEAIKCGVDPVRAITMATLNASECYKLYDKGAIAPNKDADILIVDNLKDFNIESVFVKGEKVVEGRKYLFEDLSFDIVINNFNAHKIEYKDLKCECQGTQRVIGLIKDNLLTDNLEVDCNDFDNSINKICVIDRYTGKNNIGIGFVKGYGEIDGAVATSIAHDSHNIIVIGSNDKDMTVAVNEIISNKGGLTVTQHGEVLESLPLPIAGLMTNENAYDVNDKYEHLLELAYGIGVSHDVQPFMTLSFLALPVIPSLKITDKGLFDVDKFEFVEKH